MTTECAYRTCREKEPCCGECKHRDYYERIKAAGQQQDQQWSALYPDGRFPH
jgi:hypothetical protein